MFRLARMFWKSITAGMFLLGLFWLPADVQSYDQALGPWQRLWSLFSRETLLWIFALGLFAWLVWTDARPFIRGKFKRKFPPKHAEICRKLADHLGEMRQLALASRAWVIRDNKPAPAKRANYVNFSRHYVAVQKLAGQISYDRDTADAVKDYAQICAIMVDQMEKDDHSEDEEAAIARLTPPLFEALHSGQPVNRAALPWPQWLIGTAA
jgi:hypothetical protein